MARLALVGAVLTLAACGTESPTVSSHDIHSRQALDDPPPGQIPDWDWGEPDPDGVPVPEGSVVDSQAVGTLPGQLRVGPGGQPNYHIPIKVAEGRAGMQPSLALQFAGHNRNGAAGVGWSLSGLSSISPCRKTNAQEGSPDAVRFDSSDRYCLNGARLVPVEGPNGGDGTRYRLERDRFVEIVSYGTAPDATGGVPEGFLVRRPNGDQLSYSRRIIAQQVSHADPLGATPTARDVVWSWALDSIVDPTGNTLNVQYRVVPATSPAALAFSDGFALEFYPHRITYGGHTDGLPARRGVEFIYETRPDPVDRFTSGVHHHYGERLARVDVLAPHPDSTELIWSYQLGYETSPDTGRSRLNTVAHCDARGICLPPTQVFWSNQTDTFSHQVTSLPPSRDIHQTARFSSADFDGDGRSDLLFWDGRREYCSCANAACDALTWDGITRGEDCQDIGTFRVSGEWRIAYSDGTEFPHSEATGLDAEWQTRPFAPAVSPRTTADEYNPPLVGDFDGDGRADLFASRTGEIRSPSAGYSLLQDVGSTYENLPPYWEGDVRYLGDFDGDGRSDLFVNNNRPVPIIKPSDRGDVVSGWSGPSDWTGYEWVFRLGTGSPGYGAPAATTINPYQRRHDVELGYHSVDPRRKTIALDIDGDGRTELAIPQPANRYKTFAVDANGAAAVTDTNLTYLWPGVPGLGQNSWFTPMYLDINGDGLRDVVATNGVRVHASGDIGLAARINTGNGFGPWFLAMASGYEPAEEQRHPDEIAESMTHVDPDIGAIIEFPGHAMTDDGIRIVDYNRDGRDDFLVPTASGPMLYLSTGRGFTAHPAPLALNSSVRLSAGKVWRFLGWAHRFADVNGDGMSDLVQYDTTTHEFVIQQRNGERADRLKQVINGLGRVESVVFGTLTDRTVYTPGSCGYPQRCLRGGGEVVTLLQQSAPGNGLRSTGYTYEDARIDLTGRGGLGFAAQTRTALDHQHRERTEYDVTTRQFGAYPRLGQPVRTVQEGWIDGTYKRVDITDVQHDITWAFDNRVHYTRATEIDRHTHHVTHSVDPSSPSTANRRVLSTREYDAWGNLTRDAVAVQGVVAGVAQTGSQTVTELDYDNRPTSWMIGLLTERRVTSTVNGTRQTQRTMFDIDGQGRTYRSVLEPGDPALELETTVTFGAYGEPKSIQRSASSAHPTSPGDVRVDRLEFSGEFIYPTAQINALGHRSELGIHPALGVLVRTKDPNGLLTSRQVDGFGRIRGEQFGGGTETWTDYLPGPAGPYSERFRSNAGNERSVHYDRSGAVYRVETKAFDGRTITKEYVYNHLGRLEKSSTPFIDVADLLFTRYTYDGLGRTVRAEFADGTSEQHRFYVDEVHSWDRRGNQSKIRFNVDDLAVESVAMDTDGPVAVERTTYTEYGPFGRVARITDATGAVRTISYDRRGQQVELNDPATGLRTSQYNAFGELTAEGDPVGTNAGAPTVYERDPLGRVLTRHSTDGTAFYEYDTRWIGARHRAVSPDGVETELYFDGAGRTASHLTQVDGESFEVAFTYNSTGQIQNLYYPEVEGYPRFVSRHHYAPNGQLAQITDLGNGALLWRVSARDARGNATEERFGSAVDTSHQHDLATGRLLRIRGYDTAANALFGFDFGYDANGNLEARSETVTGRVDSFAYDSLDRLSRWARRGHSAAPTFTTNYTYDPVGQLMQRDFTGGGGTVLERFDHGPGAPANALSGYERREGGAVTNRATMTYDANGRRTSGPWDNIAYSSLDKPTRVEHQGTLTEYRYDADGHKTVEANDSGGALWIGALYERRLFEGKQTHVFSVTADVGPVAQVVYDEDAGSIESRYLHRDHLGSVVAVTDDAGNLTERLWYTPFGGRTDALGVPERGPNTVAASGLPDFTGHRTDTALGLIDMRGRVYDPLGATFLTPDPIVARPGYVQGLNRYAYVYNNPLKYTDPTGFEFEWIEEVNEWEWDEEEQLWVLEGVMSDGKDFMIFDLDSSMFDSDGNLLPETPTTDEVDDTERPPSGRSVGGGVFVKTEQISWRLEADIPILRPDGYIDSYTSHIADIDILFTYSRDGNGRREVRSFTHRPVWQGGSLRPPITMEVEQSRIGETPRVQFTLLIDRERTTTETRSDTTATEDGLAAVEVAGATFRPEPSTTSTSTAFVEGGPLPAIGIIEFPAEPGRGPRVILRPSLGQGASIPYQTSGILRTAPIRLVYEGWTVIDPAGP
ncbi:MAG: RHS repeat-associated core domain-containing protein [Myxococcota bacterium]